MNKPSHSTSNNKLLLNINKTNHLNVTLRLGVGWKDQQHCRDFIVHVLKPLHPPCTPAILTLLPENISIWTLCNYSTQILRTWCTWCWHLSSAIKSSCCCWRLEGQCPNWPKKLTVKPTDEDTFVIHLTFQGHAGVWGDFLAGICGSTWKGFGCAKMRAPWQENLKNFSFMRYWSLLCDIVT